MKAWPEGIDAHERLHWHCAFHPVIGLNLYNSRTRDRGGSARSLGLEASKNWVQILILTQSYVGWDMSLTLLEPALSPVNENGDIHWAGGGVRYR